MNKASCFNPRLREGGDVHVDARDFTDKVSIHASAREATDIKVIHEGYIEFQSTPPRGRRPFVRPFHAVTVGFNPRLREGGDKQNWSRQHLRQCFNPRLREGGDHCCSGG